MRAVCVADIHGDIETLEKLEKSVSMTDIDQVILLGDFSKGFKDSVENEKDIKKVLEIFEGYNIMAIPGNCDQKDIINHLMRANANLHRTVVKRENVNIVGFGGSNPTPFNTPFEYPEEEILTCLNQLFDKVDKDAKVVLVVHAPPYDTKCDLVPTGAHVGSKSVRKIIEDKKPGLVLCSHIHESGGKEDKIGETRILNIGRMSEGNAYILNLENLEIIRYT
ncbi:MAG: metallophosphoesterase [Candidatus Altiarchaeota archaeon]|nr:metallophosphoesterase [Candidatus Altiarchaeota archaeon]